VKGRVEGKNQGSPGFDARNGASGMCKFCRGYSSYEVRVRCRRVGDPVLFRFSVPGQVRHTKRGVYFVSQSCTTVLLRIGNSTVYYGIVQIPILDNA
jgi:hypothetical protein